MVTLTLNSAWIVGVGIGIVLVVLVMGGVVWGMFRSNAKTNKLLEEMHEEVTQYQVNVGLLSQAVKDLGQHFNSNFSALYGSQQHLSAQVIKLREGVVQVERALTSKIIEGDQRSNEALQRLREDTFKSIAHLHEEVLKVMQALQQGSSAQIHALQESLLADIGQLKEQVSILHIQSRERKELERQTAESIKRLEAILAGVQSKGAAGERIVERVFSKLPAEWRIRNFRVNGKVVEFGLRLPNGLVLPIDSKWPSSDLVDKFANTENPEERIILKREIERAVLRKAQEARKYVDPSQTLPFAVIVVPDAVFDLSMGVHAESVQIGVAILSYSMFVPYLLLVFHTIMKSSQSFDIQALATHLENVSKNLSRVQEEIEGRFSRALTMLNNSRDALRAHLQQANASLISLEISADVKEIGE